MQVDKHIVVHGGIGVVITAPPASFNEMKSLCDAMNNSGAAQYMEGGGGGQYMVMFMYESECSIFRCSWDF